MTQHSGPAQGRPLLTTSGSQPLLAGHRCEECGRVAFPPDPYGCEACGATVDRLSPVDLPARGRIRALAEVHRHHRPEPPTPFTVATIVLEAGPVLKAVLDQPHGWSRVGAEVIGVVTEGGDLRFGQAATGTGAD